MFDFVYTALNVRENERDQVRRILAHGFFMGVFFATFKVASETLFLTNLGGDWINIGIFTAAVFGTITTAIFSFFQNKIPYSQLSVLNLLTIFIITSLLYIAYISAPPEYLDYIIFLIFAMNGSVTAVFLLGFWGVFGRMFDLRQSKRIIGGIDTGQLLAAIIAFFLIGFGDLAISTEDYLAIAAGSVLLSMVFLFSIKSKYNIDVVQAHEIAQAKTSFKDLSKNKYALLLALFLTLSITAFLFIERTYLTVLEVQYGDSETELRNFNAWFNGSILVFSFVFQTFFNDRIIANYGLKTSLLISPIVLSIFVIVTILYGFFFGYQPGTAFGLFFLFISLGKLFVSFLRDAMENPAFKLYFMPLDFKERFDIQSKLEGVVNELAKVVAGGVLLGLGLLTFFEVIHYYYFVIVIIGLWIYMVGFLYNEYRVKIKEKLLTEDSTGGSGTESGTLKRLLSKLDSFLSSANTSIAIFSFKMIEKLNPNKVGHAINSLMKHENEEVRNFAQLRMNEFRGLSVSDTYVIKTQTDTVGADKVLVKGDDLTYLLKTGEVPKMRIYSLSRSLIPQDRQYAAELIGNSEAEDILSFLIELLRDTNPKVRVAALNSAEKTYNKEVLLAVIENLEFPAFSSIATNVLVIVGEPSLEVLDAAFHRTGQSHYVMLKIIRIMGRIGGLVAQRMLWNKIDYPDKEIVSEILKALGDSHFKADIDQVSRIKFAIESDIEDVAWNLAAYYEVHDNKFGKNLRLAIKEENNHDYEHIYMLLAMLYDKHSIDLVKENLESGTSEDITYAIELLDVFLSEELKQKIIPILDDVSDQEKVKKLEEFFPREKYGTKEVLKLIINRDFNQTNRWTKACAIYAIGLMKIEEYTYDLIANLYNPDKLVLEVSAWSLYQLGPELYMTHTRRLDEYTFRQLDEMILPEHKGDFRTLRYDKVLFLKTMPIYAKSSGILLANLADFLEEVKINSGESLNLKGQNKDYFYIAYEGSMNLYSLGNVKMQITSGDFIGENPYGEEENNDSTLIAESPSILWRIRKERLYEILSDNIDFARNLVDQIEAA